MGGGCKRLKEFEGKVTLIIHMGACSATTETDFDYLYKNNFEYTKTLWDFAVRNSVRFIYASSAATYGDGNQGFDDRVDIEILKPLNGYGYSKQLFDLWVEKQRVFPKQYVGFKFFNVYGPNEYCKGSMASIIFHAFRQISETGQMRLFKSYLDSYQDGEQQRDFIYVKDICKVVKFVIEHEEINGLFNLGTGKAESFNQLAYMIFDAMGIKRNISYIEMPEHLKKKYQYFTEAKIDRLRDAGYREQFFSLRDGVMDYVQNYLMRDYKIY